MIVNIEEILHKYKKNDINKKKKPFKKHYHMKKK